MHCRKNNDNHLNWIYFEIIYAHGSAVHPIASWAQQVQDDSKVLRNLPWHLAEDWRAQGQRLDVYLPISHGLPSVAKYEDT